MVNKANTMTKDGNGFGNFLQLKPQQFLTMS